MKYDGWQAFCASVPPPTVLTKLLSRGAGSVLSQDDREFPLSSVQFPAGAEVI